MYCIWLVIWPLMVKQKSCLDRGGMSNFHRKLKYFPSSTECFFLRSLTACMLHIFMLHFAGFWFDKNRITFHSSDSLWQSSFYLQIFRTIVCLMVRHMKSITRQEWIMCFCNYIVFRLVWLGFSLVCFTAFNAKSFLCIYIKYDS